MGGERDVYFLNGKFYFLHTDDPKITEVWNASKITLPNEFGPPFKLYVGTELRMLKFYNSECIKEFKAAVKSAVKSAGTPKYKLNDKVWFAGPTGWGKGRVIRVRDDPDEVSRTFQDLLHGTFRGYRFKNHYRYDIARFTMLFSDTTAKEGWELRRRKNHIPPYF